MDNKLLELHKLYGKHSYELLGTLEQSERLYYCKCGCFTLQHEPVLGYAMNSRHKITPLIKVVSPVIQQHWQEYVALIESLYAIPMEHGRMFKLERIIGSGPQGSYLYEE